MRQVRVPHKCPFIAIVTVITFTSNSKCNDITSFIILGHSSLLKSCYSYDIITIITATSPSSP